VGLLFASACGRGDTPTGRARDVAAPNPQSVEASAGFYREVGAQRALDIDLARAEDGRWFMPDSMAGGVALADFDGDGDLDLALAHGRWREGAPTADGLARLWLQGADGRFTDASASAGVIGPHYGLGLAVGDIDNDGDLDLYITCFGPDVLLQNHGDGTFEDVSVSAGLRAPARASEADAPHNAVWGASCTFVDVDADGWLDLFVTNYVDYPPGDAAKDTRGNPEYPSPMNYAGAPDVLLANRGDGTFLDVSLSSGIGAVPGRGLGVAAGDFDGDGRVDLYVANDAQANFCWIQRGGDTPAEWRFEERAFHLGLALSGDGRAEASMGVARGDLDGDGREDLILTHLAQETHTLYLSRDNAGFDDRTVRAGLAGPTVDLTGFGAALTDVDLDGRLDLVAVHGRVLRGPERPGAAEAARWRPYAEPGLVLLGRGERGGAPRFVVADGGDFTRRIETGRGLALGDLDGDGDVDLVVTSAAGAVRVYERLGAPNEAAWIGARAVDPARGGRDVLGAVVELEAPDGAVQRRTIQTCHGYLSASEAVARFGLEGDGVAPVAFSVALSVTWPDGARERFEGLAPGRVYTLRRDAGQPR